MVYYYYYYIINKNTDGLVNRLASNMVILNQAHRVAWLIGQNTVIRLRQLQRDLLPIIGSRDRINLFHLYYGYYL